MQSLFDLEAVVKKRKENYVSGSYTSYLFEQGLDKILKKCGEECAEVIISAKNADSQRIVEEISDLLYHIVVLASELKIPLSRVDEELSNRAKKQLNLKAKKESNPNS